MPGNIIILSSVIQTPLDLQQVSQVMDTISNISEWSVDLEDCDQMMRVVCSQDIGMELVGKLAEVGISAVILEIFDTHGASKMSLGQAIQA
ncbi:hypothetical protein [Pedobacter gandavensis]|uniref:Uncharacterized protein n=1 Tax=Pedobacter gandavensis TaxID=2679963 RepID=A0ABR6EW74_9SPHI|nr:hypothetical protein [Pedobacter gandavensis]MBB2149277.1 hypothetical protein [Pedobacter gandavensis]